ncbi:hypothetical protein DPMN_023364 [Dreissena polymorpha]|uniref:Uncharacterized protein n=2 Tax=Dreissena polymorpha TaxID=45954 RepID=A0A9D4LM79_DREPO|nr:hypothetical protein DPMN_023364 [Dreissena polymorpha]
MNSSCYDRIHSHSNTSYVFNADDSPPTFNNETDLCNKSKVCAKNTTACNGTFTKVECRCTADYVDITFYNNASDSFYACTRPVTSTTSTTTTYTTMTSTTDTTTTLYAFANSSTIVPHEYPTTQMPNKTDSLPNTVTTSAATVNTVGPKAETTTQSNVDVGVKKDDKPESSSNTSLIATGASLGIVVLILIITIIVVCRLRSKKAQDTERVKLRELEKGRRNGFDNSLLGRNYLVSDSKQNSVDDLRATDRETDRDDRRNSYYGGPFKPIEPTYTRPFKSAEPKPIWDRHGHVPGLKGRTGSLPDINDHVDMRIAPETRRMSQPRHSDPLYSSPRKDKDPPPTQKPVDNYRQNMVRVFPESGERLPRAKTNQFPRKNASGRISPEPDYYDDPPLSPKPDYNGRKSLDRVDASRDSGLNGFSRSSGSPEVQRSRESFGYGSLGRGRYRMEDTPF